MADGRGRRVVRPRGDPSVLRVEDGNALLVSEQHSFVKSVLLLPRLCMSSAAVVVRTGLFRAPDLFLVATVICCLRVPEWR